VFSARSLSSQMAGRGNIPQICGKPPPFRRAALASTILLGCFVRSAGMDAAEDDAVGRVGFGLPVWRHYSG